MSRLRRAVAILAWLITCVAWQGHAQEPAASETAREPALPAFHRTFIPADEISSQTWLGGYLPIDFEPGTKWQYSDGGPNWLADCVTLARGTVMGISRVVPSSRAGMNATPIFGNE